MDAIQLLLSKNAEERNNKIEFLASGGARDYAQYQHVCGVIRGLDIADSYLTDLAKRMNNDE